MRYLVKTLVSRVSIIITEGPLYEILCQGIVNLLWVMVSVSVVHVVVSSDVRTISKATATVSARTIMTDMGFVQLMIAINRFLEKDRKPVLMWSTNRQRTRIRRREHPSLFFPNVS